MGKHYKKVIKENGKRLATIEDNLDEPKAQFPNGELPCPECHGNKYVMDFTTGQVHTCWFCMGSGVYKK